MGVGVLNVGFSQSVWLPPPFLLSLSLSHTHMHTDGNINHNCFRMAELWVVCAFLIFSKFFLQWMCRGEH